MKTMKKVSSLILALLLMAGMCSVPAFAAETGCKNVLSDTIYTFDGEVIGTYGVVKNSEVNNTTSAETDATTYAGNRAEIAPETGGSDNKVLKLTQGNASNGVTVQTWTGSTTQSLFHLNFDIKKSGGDAGYFGITSYQGSRYVYLLRMYGKTIYLNNTEVYTYELNKWYNLDLQMDLQDHYIKLAVTDESGNIKTIDLPYEKTFTNKVLETDRTAISNFYFGWVAGNASGGTVYIDNYMQNTGSDLTPTLNSHNDTFDTMPIYDDSYSLNTTEKGVKTVGARTGWYGKGIYGSSESDLKTTVSVEEGKLKIATAEDSRFPMLIKAPFYSAPAVKHRIRFKMSGVQNETKKSQGFWVDFAATATAGITKEKQVAIQMEPGELKLGSMTFNNFDWDPSYMYPCEFIYDATDEVAVITLADKDGTQYSVDWSEALQTAFGTDAAWGNLYQLRYRLASGTDGNAVTYLDDFQWDIFNDDEIAVTPSVKYTGNDGSPLDETVKFAFNRPISSDATVAVTSNGEAVTTPYTTSVESGVLSVKFSDLALNTAYDVTVDVDALESDVTPAESYTYSFSTVDAEKAISATTPTLDGTSISSTVTSYYAEGRPAMLIAALYKGNELVKVITQPLDKADSRDGEVVSLNISGYEYDEIRSFVWSGFSQLIPYSEALK